ncbi:MAG: LacI family transcriptional regulator [Solobacterium sp.]|nr:LacI family transcriptional regulator [Solobacterium sp.]
MATIKDIARKSGYSIGTVSRVINHHPDVSDKARALIEQIIAEEGFQPNQNAQQLKSSVSPAVAVIVKGTRNSFLSDLLVKVEERLMKRGEEVSVVFIGEEENAVLTAARHEQITHPKGFIFLGGSRENFLSDFSRIHTPAVVISTWMGDLNIPGLSSFSTDDSAASAAAVKLLVEKGRKNIGFIGGHMSFAEDGSIISPRLKGAAEELKKAGLPFDRRRQFVASHFTFSDSYEAALRLLGINPETDGLFAHSDIMALGAMRAIHDAGRKIPEDIAVVGYDGIRIGEYSVPRLTSILQDTDAMTEKAVSDLLQRISGEKETVSHELIPFKIVERESTE